jgi:hypothetical protein
MASSAVACELRLEGFAELGKDRHLILSGFWLQLFRYINDNILEAGSAEVGDIST